MTNLEKAKELASKAEKAICNITIINELSQVIDLLTQEEKSEYNKWLSFREICRKAYAQCLSK